MPGEAEARWLTGNEPSPTKHAPVEKSGAIPRSPASDVVQSINLDSAPGAEPGAARGWSTGESGAASRPQTPARTQSPQPKVLMPHGAAPVHDTGQRAASARPTTAANSNDLAASEHVLAEGWEKDIDPRTGRTFFVNHAIKKWSWNAPLSNPQRPPAAIAAPEDPDPAKSRSPPEAPEDSNAPAAPPASPSANSSRSTHGLADRKKEANFLGRDTQPEGTTSEVADPRHDSASTRLAAPERVENARIEQEARHFTGTALVHSPLAQAESSTPVSFTASRAESPSTNGNADDSIPQTARGSHRVRDYARVEHDREVEQLKSELDIIRSQSKNLHKSPHDLSGRSVRALAYTFKPSQHSPMTKIDISKIRQAPYAGNENSILPENAGDTYRQVAAAQYGLPSPRGDNILGRASVPAGLSMRGDKGTFEQVLLDAKSLDWNSASIEARLAVRESKSVFDSKSVFRLASVCEKLLAVGANMHSRMTTLARDSGNDEALGDDLARVAGSNRDSEQIHPRYRDRRRESYMWTELESNPAQVHEKSHVISLLREQQTCLLKALKECDAVIGSEIKQLHQLSYDYKARCVQAASARKQVEAQLEEQREEMLHIQKSIVQPSIEDMVLIDQLSSMTEKLLVAREKQSVQVESNKMACEQSETSISFLQQVLAVLQDCVGNLEPGDSSSTEKRERPQKNIILSDEEASIKKCDSQKEMGAQVASEVVQVAAEVEDTCMELHWMVGLVSQLGEDAMSASSSEGQNRLLLMQQEQMRGLKDAVNGALKKASSATARVLSDAASTSMNLSVSHIGEPESRILWHQARYHSDKRTWMEERNALEDKLAKAQQDSESLREKIGTQSLKIHELVEALQAAENEKALLTSEHARTMSDLRRAIEHEKSVTAEKNVQVTELEVLLQSEKRLSESVVRQAVRTLQTMSPEDKVKLHSFNSSLDKQPQHASESSENLHEQLHAELMDSHNRHTVIDPVGPSRQDRKQAQSTYRENRTDEQNQLPRKGSFESISSSSDESSFSDNLSFDGAEAMASAGKTMRRPKFVDQEDPLVRFQKWHARTSVPRDVLSGGDETTSPKSAWNVKMMPSEWLIQTHSIEAFNLPKHASGTLCSFACCISLIQDLNGVSYQDYLLLDHLPRRSAESHMSRTGTDGVGRRIWIRPQHMTHFAEPSTDPTWAEVLTFTEMHPNPVVLDRLNACGHLALSNERVLLSGLPVHLLVSVTSSEV